MRFEGTSVRSLTKLLKIAGDATKVRLAVPLNDISEDLLESLGFSKTPIVGDWLVPSVIGKYTKFNANGDEIILKDKPLISKTIMYYGANRDWHGGLHYGLKTRTIKKRPRKAIKAPSETFEIVEINKNLFLSSSVLDLGDIEKSRNIHVTNLMLECFSKFDIYDTEKQEIVGPRLKHLQWDVLPSGEYPWERAKTAISQRTAHLEEKDRKVIEYRMMVIAQKKPDFLALGRGGFSGYFVYGFTEKDIYILESMELGNATYIFNSDWEALSKLTKSQIINSNLPHQRIIHNKSWKLSINRAISANT